MFSRFLSTTAVVLAATQLVSAQTSTECNPMEKKCPDDPALGTSVDVDFTKGENELFKEFPGTKLTYDENGAVFTINTEKDAPTIGSTKYIFFGRVDVTVKASTGVGVVTSFVLQSDDLDEIDWEWLGGDETQVQSNYFGKGDTTTYDRGAFHTVSTPQTTDHTYSIDWTKDRLQWIIDGSVVRELKYADAKGGSRYPQTPMQIRLGTWVAGRKDAPEGTVEWAGGYTDFSQAPFLAYYKDLKITDYSNGVKGATSYSWGDKSDGSYQSIKVLTDGSGDDSTSSSTSEPTSTKSADKSTSTDSSKTTATTLQSSVTSGSTTASATDSPSGTSSGSGESTATPTDSSSSDSSSDSPSETGEASAAPSTSDIAQAGAGAFKAGLGSVVMGLLSSLLLL